MASGGAPGNPNDQVVTRSTLAFSSFILTKASTPPLAASQSRHRVTTSATSPAHAVPTRRSSSTRLTMALGFAGQMSRGRMSHEGPGVDLTRSSRCGAMLPAKIQRQVPRCACHWRLIAELPWRPDVRDWSAQPAAAACCAAMPPTNPTSATLDRGTDLRADHFSSNPKPIPKPDAGA